MHIQHQDSLLAFLETSSNRVEHSLSELMVSLNISEESDVASRYFESLKYYKTALESNNPNEVISHVKSWLKIEKPYVKFMSSIRDIIVLHKRRLGMEDNPEGIDVVDYVFINSTHLMNQPFMLAYKGTVYLLSEQMIRVQPGRKAMILAYESAIAQITPEGVMKKDKIIEDINKAKIEGTPVPKVCDALITN